MDAAFLKSVITKRRVIPVIMPGYRYASIIRLFGAIIVAELHLKGDKDSLNASKDIQKNIRSLTKRVQTTIRPIVGDTADLSNDLNVLQQWATTTKRNVVIKTFDPEKGTLEVIFDTHTAFDGIELLKTEEDGQIYYHALLNADRFLYDAMVLFNPFTKEETVRQRNKRARDEFVLDFKSKLLKLKEAVRNDPELGGHVEASVSWNQLNYAQKNHLLMCSDCAYPYYNDNPEEECLLMIYSPALKQECKVTPYRYLHIVAENDRLGITSDDNKNNSCYLNHVEKYRLTLKDNGERFMDFVKREADLSREQKMRDLLL